MASITKPISAPLSLLIPRAFVLATKPGHISTLYEQQSGARERRENYNQQMLLLNRQAGELAQKKEALNNPQLEMRESWTGKMLRLCGLKTRHVRMRDELTRIDLQLKGINKQRGPLERQLQGVIRELRCGDQILRPLVLNPKEKDPLKTLAIVMSAADLRGPKTTSAGLESYGSKELRMLRIALLDGIKEKRIETLKPSVDGRYELCPQEETVISVEQAIQNRLDVVNVLERIGLRARALLECDPDRRKGFATEFLEALLPDFYRSLPFEIVCRLYSDTGAEGILPMLTERAGFFEEQGPLKNDPGLLGSALNKAFAVMIPECRKREVLLKTTGHEPVYIASLDDYSLSGQERLANAYLMSQGLPAVDLKALTPLGKIFLLEYIIREAAGTPDRFIGLPDSGSDVNIALGTLADILNYNPEVRSRAKPRRNAA